MGDVIGDLNSRRGLINKFEDKPGGMKVVQVSRGSILARHRMVNNTGHKGFPQWGSSA
jgi:hypothetical protein